MIAPSISKSIAISFISMSSPKQLIFPTSPHKISLQIILPNQYPNHIMNFLMSNSFFVHIGINLMGSAEEVNLTKVHQVVHMTHHQGH